MADLIGIDVEYNQLLPSKENIRYASFAKKISSNEYWITTDNIYPGDELFTPPGSNEPIKLDIIRKALMFYFNQPLGGWQEGEGCVYINNQMYTVFMNNVVGYGSGVTGSARDAMLEMEKTNKNIDSSNFKLQRWAVQFEYGGTTRTKACIKNETVDIPKF